MINTIKSRGAAGISSKRIMNLVGNHPVTCSTAGEINSIESSNSSSVLFMDVIVFNQAVRYSIGVNPIIIKISDGVIQNLIAAGSGLRNAIIPSFNYVILNQVGIAVAAGCRSAVSCTADNQRSIVGGCAGGISHDVAV